MRKATTSAHEKLSVSLSALASRQKNKFDYNSATFASGIMARGAGPEVDDFARVAALVEVTDAMSFTDTIDGPGIAEAIALADTYVTVVGTPVAVASLANRTDVLRVQAKKEKEMLLDAVPPEIGLCTTASSRTVDETGRGVLIGIIDSGFDLSHPTFHNAAGQLRVEALLDQTTGRMYDTTALEHSWASGDRVGDDESGHGTHVASIAAGSQTTTAHEGVAPDSRLLLVKTDMVRTDDAVAWIFARASERNQPCVVNLSLGHHLGSHDGSDAEERLFENLTAQPGRVIVVAGGNERDRAVHVSGYFYPGQVEEFTLDLLRRPRQLPNAITTFWFDYRDRFAFELIPPSGQPLSFPKLNNIDQYTSSWLDVELSLKQYVRSSSTYAQAAIGVRSDFSRSMDLRGWKFRVTCEAAYLGRLDGWVSHTEHAEFRAHRYLDPACTIGLPGTGEGTITVASYVSKNAWPSDGGSASDIRAVVGRASSFSSLGPTRNGR